MKTLFNVEVIDERWRPGKPTRRNPGRGPAVLIRRWHVVLTTDTSSKAIVLLNDVRTRLSGPALKDFMERKPRIRMCRDARGRWHARSGVVLLSSSQLRRAADDLVETFETFQRTAAVAQG